MFSRSRDATGIQFGPAAVIAVEAFVQRSSERDHTPSYTFETTPRPRCRRADVDAGPLPAGACWSANNSGRARLPDQCWDVDPPRRSGPDHVRRPDRSRLSRRRHASRLGRQQRLARSRSRHRRDRRLGRRLAVRRANGAREGRGRPDGRLARDRPERHQAGARGCPNRELIRRERRHPPSAQLGRRRHLGERDRSGRSPGLRLLRRSGLRRPRQLLPRLPRLERPVQSPAAARTEHQRRPELLSRRDTRDAGHRHERRSRCGQRLARVRLDDPCGSCPGARGRRRLQPAARSVRGNRAQAGHRGRARWKGARRGRESREPELRRSERRSGRARPGRVPDCSAVRDPRRLPVPAAAASRLGPPRNRVYFVYRGRRCRTGTRHAASSSAPRATGA